MTLQPQSSPTKFKATFAQSSPLILCSILVIAGCMGTASNQSNSTTTTGDSLERTSEKGPVKLLVRVTPREPRLSDLVEMEIIATGQKDVEIKPPAFGQAVGDFLVRDYSERTGPNAKTQ